MLLRAKMHGETMPSAKKYEESFFYTGMETIIVVYLMYKAAYAIFSFKTYYIFNSKAIFL